LNLLRLRGRFFVVLICVHLYSHLTAYGHSMLSPSEAMQYDTYTGTCIWQGTCGTMFPIRILCALYDPAVYPVKDLYITMILPCILSKTCILLWSCRVSCQRPVYYVTCRSLPYKL